MKFPKFKIPHIPYATFLLGPFFVFAFGIFVNMIVMAANHSQMPFVAPGGVCPDLSGDIWHVCMEAHTRLKWLADWAVFRESIASPADFLIYAGDRLMIPSWIAWFVLIIKRVNELELRML